jgi:hypothetical protein
LKEVLLDIHARLEAALAADKPRARLQILMAELLEHGLERDDIFGALESFQARLASEGREAERELILETMDGFTGWCRID